MEIDRASWEVTLLSPPKRRAQSKAFGFCARSPVGTAWSARGEEMPFWWSAPEPVALSLQGFKSVSALSARDDMIVGSWSKSGSGVAGAASWRLSNGELIGRNLHVPSFEKSWATSACAGVTVGVGVRKARQGPRARDIGLIWSEDGDIREISGDDGDVNLLATDGRRHAGSLDGRAALWPSFDSAPIDLAPPNMPASEIRALDGESLVGLAFNGLAARAILWRGSAASAIDLTPAGFDVSQAFDGANGHQVGLIRRAHFTRNGSLACDNQAVIWAGDNDRWFDLHAVLPTRFNASIARAISVVGDRVLVCGEAMLVKANDGGTPSESHEIWSSQAALWAARRVDRVR